MYLIILFTIISRINLQLVFGTLGLLKEELFYTIYFEKCLIYHLKLMIKS